MSEQLTLKPCPFCDGKAFDHAIEPHTHVIATFMPDHPGSHVVECSRCNVGIIADTKEAAFAAWNRRACEPAEPVTLPQFKVESMWGNGVDGSHPPVSAADARDALLGAAVRRMLSDGVWNLEDSPKSFLSNCKRLVEETAALAQEGKR